MSLFPAPPLLNTTVFTRLPDVFRQAQVTPWSQVNRYGRAMDSFLEGPAFDAAGHLYVVDIPFGRVFRIDPEGQWEQAMQYDGQPNGLKVRSDGCVFIADHKLGIVYFDPAKKTIHPFCTRHHGEPFRGCNDLIFHSNGDLYFTDQGQSGLHEPNGRVFRCSPEGKTECLLSGLPSPNGLAFNVDESELYVTVTRANAVWRLPFLLDGGVSKVGLFLSLSGGIGPDGMAVDVVGNLVVCHIGTGVVWQFAPTGEPMHRIQSCAGLGVTNVAYGGADNSSIFITESAEGVILQADLKTPGLINAATQISS